MNFISSLLKILFIPLFLLLHLYGYSQSTKISGTVKDSLNVPLEMASVLAIDKTDNSVHTYAITDHRGRYQINLPQQKEFVLRASFLGLKPAEEEIFLLTGQEIRTVDFTLLTDENLLEDVELVYEMPVIKRGDTLIYNADSFTNGTERKLEDLMKKLPGVSVNDEGEIEVDGKRVSKVMIDGKDFFEGDSKLANKNIPADAVSKVEVLRNFNEINQMRGLGNDEENIAINLKLKEGKKNFWFGEVEGGIGEGEGVRYGSGARLFYYSPKGSVNVIASSNTIGEVPFTLRDYFNFTGNFPSSGGMGTVFSMADSELGFLTTQNNRANETRSHFGAANFTYQVSKSWDISGFSLLSNNHTGFINRTLRQFIQTGATEEINNQTGQDSRLGMAKFKSVYKPNENFQLNYDVLVKTSQQEELNDAVSIFSNGNVINPLLEEKKNEPFSLTQRANFYYTLNDRNIFAGAFTHLLSDEDPFYNLNTGILAFENILPLMANQNTYDISQQRRIETQKLDGKVDYFFVLNKLSNLNFTLGATHSRQKFLSAMYEELEDAGINWFNEEFLNNDVDFDFRDLFFGVRYKVKTGIFTFTPGLSLHKYTVENSQKDLTTLLEKNLVLPSFFALAQFRQSESLRFNYQMTADFTDVNNYAEAYIFRSYNRLFRGNRLLENAVYHSLSLNYFNFNMFNFTNMYGGINYSRRIDAISTTSIVEQINLVSTPFNSNLPEETLSFNGSFEKTFKKIKARANSNLMFNKFNLLVNEEWQQSQNFTQNYRGSLLTNFKKSPHLEIGYSRSINRYTNGNLENTFFTDRPFANIEINFLRGFRFTAEWSYNNYFSDDKTVTNEYSFVESSLFYRNPKSQWEFSLDGKNLLDVTSLNRDSFNETFSTTTEYFVMPRIIMATVKYHL